MNKFNQNKKSGVKLQKSKRLINKLINQKKLYNLLIKDLNKLMKNINNYYPKKLLNSNYIHKKLHEWSQGKPKFNKRLRTSLTRIETILQKQ